MIRKTDLQTIAPYLKDASNFDKGCADEVIIPETVEELTEYLRSTDIPVTVAGAGTGLTASRIPQEGVIVSMERFNHLGDIQDGTIEVGPAVSLSDLQNHLRSTPFFYPPNPTEALAWIGGTVATNASGSRSYKFGATREYVLEADIVFARGQKIRLARGHKITEPLRLDDGSSISFPEIRYTSPQCKNAAGYYVRPGMDWLDLFIGSDGTLGIFTSLRLKLLARPARFISAVLFFNKEDDCWRLVETIRAQKNAFLSPCSLEYFDTFSLNRLRLKFELVPERARAALFFESDIANEEEYDVALDTWFDFLSREEVLLDDSWFAECDRDLQKFHDFRHEIPVLINEENSRLGRIKMGTDMAVEDEHLIDMLEFYRKVLSNSGLEYVMFGHLGDNHLHINLLPDKSQLESARATYHSLVEGILKWNGTISAEHGVGKLKKEYFHKMVGPEALRDMKMIKKTIDPDSRLGAGNIL